MAVVGDWNVVLDLEKTLTTRWLFFWGDLGRGLPKKRPVFVSVLVVVVVGDDCDHPMDRGCCCCCCGRGMDALFCLVVVGVAVAMARACLRSSAVFFVGVVVVAVVDFKIGFFGLAAVAEADEADVGDFKIDGRAASAAAIDASA